MSVKLSEAGLKAATQAVEYFDYRGLAGIIARKAVEAYLGEAQGDLITLAQARDVIQRAIDDGRVRVTTRSVWNTSAGKDRLTVKELRKVTKTVEVDEWVEV